MMEIWTIGHFSHAIETFADLLVQNQIAILVDIRRFPGSRTFPQFNRETLGPSLQSYGIDYLWIESLGGRRSKVATAIDSPNEGWQNKSFRNYADHMQTEQFQTGFQELVDTTQRGSTAIMCSEAVYWRCHRRLISDYVVAFGGVVHHIFPDGRTKPHVLTDFTQIDSTSSPPQLTYPPSPTLFD
jgi:uncharacterized protein (DUF488 family)